MGSLRNLTHLKLSNCCTDQLLAVIGANCRNLEVLDAEEDSGKTNPKYFDFINFGMIKTIDCKLAITFFVLKSEMMTTDSGLAFLANCDKLRTVILNDAGDEYDYEDRYFGITGKGIANLLIALPKVNK